MTKNELINDMNFRKACTAYGLDWQNFNVYENIIILNSPKKDVFVLLDDHYNTIGIPRIEYSSPARTIEEYAIGYKELYDYVDEEEKFIFPYPFQNLSLKQIIELANRVYIHETNHGHSSDMIVNGELVNDENDSVYISLLSYIKFLGQQIEQYFMNLYQMKMMGFQYPNVYQYISSIMNNINECIDANIKKGNRPFPIDIIEYLGQDRKNIEECDHELYRIINLLLKQKGVKFKGGFEHYRELEMTDKDTTDLSNISMQLLKILEVPAEEVELRYQESNRTFEFKEVNLHSWLSESFKKDKSPVLTKSQK